MSGRPISQKQKLPSRMMASLLLPFCGLEAAVFQEERRLYVVGDLVEASKETGAKVLPEKLGELSDFLFYVRRERTGRWTGTSLGLGVMLTMNNFPEHVGLLL